MTDEEKAEEYVKEQILKHNRDAVLRPKNAVTYIDELKQAYLDGLAEGRKELEQWKQEWKDAQIKANEEGYARTTLQIKYKELEKEYAELKKEISILLSCSNCPENKGGYICGKEYNDKCLSQKIEYIKELKAENEELKNVIEEAIKDHCLFRQNEVIDFTSKCVWKALNPDTKMCVPNAMFIKIEELLKDYIEKELAE